MKFLKNTKPNWKYILVVVILAIIVGEGVGSRTPITTPLRPTVFYKAVRIFNAHTIPLKKDIKLTPVELGTDEMILHIDNLSQKNINLVYNSFYKKYLYRINADNKSFYGFVPYSTKVHEGRPGAGLSMNIPDLLRYSGKSGYPPSLPILPFVFRTFNVKGEIGDKPFVIAGTVIYMASWPEWFIISSIIVLILILIIFFISKKIILRFINKLSYRKNVKKPTEKGRDPKKGWYHGLNILGGILLVIIFFLFLYLEYSANFDSSTFAALIRLILFIFCILGGVLLIIIHIYLLIRAIIKGDKLKLIDQRKRRRLQWLIGFIVFLLFIAAVIEIYLIVAPEEYKLTIHYVGHYLGDKNVPLYKGWVGVTESSIIGPGAGEMVATGHTDSDGKITFILPRGTYDIRVTGGYFPNEDKNKDGIITIGPNRWGGFHEVLLYFNRTVKIKMRVGI